MDTSTIQEFTNCHRFGPMFWIALHIAFLLLFSNVLTKAEPQFLSGKEHVTTKAAEQLPPIWCYQCESMEPTGPCVNLSINASHDLGTKCPKERRMCMVRRYSYTTSTENSTSSPRMWALERNCTERCDAGCIIIGERTKLYACTSCCSTSFCNVGSVASAHIPDVRNILTMAVLQGTAYVLAINMF
ncbi:uncharacterized protein LOC126235888 isoform X1 [Schistocerca nitens]|uniref:uncharacterized protein LOC126235888 isoform X1 n=1 Tax=Schistocerca nitens TaxID=7011 RepID=UPI0021174A73|nr:uncharacterized protein LOC126235888 isoform X1 [Schistocerca nitens]